MTDQVRVWVPPEVASPPLPQAIPVTTIPDAEFFFLSNDDLSMPVRPGAGPCVFLGVASPHSLHVLSLTLTCHPVRAAVFIDVNPGQLRHLHRLLQHVRHAEGRIDFIQRVLCTEFSTQAVAALQGLEPEQSPFVRGSDGARAWAERENDLWSGAVFREDEFIARYGVRGRADGRGILVKTQMLGRPLLQRLCVLGSDGRGRETPLLASFGCGYLRSENAFRALARALTRLPTAYVWQDISEVLDPLLRWAAPNHIVLYCSNIFHRFFVEYFPALGGAATRVAELATAGNVTVVADRREPEAQLHGLNCLGQ